MTNEPPKTAILNRDIHKLLTPVARNMSTSVDVSSGSAGIAKEEGGGQDLFCTGVFISWAATQSQAGRPHNPWRRRSQLQGHSWGHSRWSHLPDTARGASIRCSSHAGYRRSGIDKSALPSALFIGEECEKPIMASMTVDSISAYHLRKDTLLEYLRSVFPTHSNYITVEPAPRTMYTLTIPRALTQAERDHIIDNLRELGELGE
ncbi:hypothetical protein LA080_010020 [Diaporthe eres]|nr:hypothetical protein LA080_010020 [Diaporthe eres]